jgi:preprotein translocase subunit SecY
MSVMIFTQIIAVVPGQLRDVYLNKGPATFTVVMIMGVALVAFVALMEQAQRRIPIQYAKRMIGRRMYGGTSTYIPLKINQAGVIPVIFAASLLYIPQLVAQLFGAKVNGQPAATGWAAWVNQNLVIGNTQTPTAYMIVYTVLLLFFTYFYVSITFNPTEVADNMKRSGGFIPGIRPGAPTAGYLHHVLNRLTAAGAVYLAIVALIPLIAVGLLDATQQFPLGGTSILIMVGVGLDTVKQLESQLQQRNYEGFLR